MINTGRAQQLDCSANVKKALQVTSDKCSQLTRNKACYGSGLVIASPIAGATDFMFHAPGDMVDISEISSLRLAALDPKGTQWGVAYMRIQANLPDTTAGQYVTMLIFGDVLLEDESQNISNGAAPTKPIQAVYFRTGVGSPVCHDAPTSGLLIQAPKGAETVHLTVDGVQLGVNSTVFIQAPSSDLNNQVPIAGTKAATSMPTSSPTASPLQTAATRSVTKGPKLTITTIQGHVTVTSNGHTKVISNNQSVTVTLNDQGDAPVDDPVIEPPSDNMGALVDLTTQDGSDGLYLTQPDLSATEDFFGTLPPDSTNMPTPTDNLPTDSTFVTAEAIPTVTNSDSISPTPEEPTAQNSDSQPTAGPSDGTSGE